MDYLKHYNRLIESRRHRILQSDVRYEIHHVIMKSMGGTDDACNLVHLTPREHFIAHQLLWLIHRNRQTAFAFRMMCNMQKHGSAKLYEKLKGIGEHLKTVHTDDTKNQLRMMNLGKKYSDEINKSKGNSGVSKTSIHRANISKALKGNPKKVGHVAYTKPVFQYDENNQLLNHWVSVKDAAKKLKISMSGISGACHGHFKSYKGFIWKHENNVP